MLPEPPRHLVRYRPDLEQPDADEGRTGEGLREQVLKIAETTWRHGGHAQRGVHAKSHGLLNAQMIVDPNLPVVLRQGMFSAGGRYLVIMRFSTTPGDILPDTVSTPRGLALKVFGVTGDRLQGDSGATQDFVLVNGKSFATPDAKRFLASLKALAASADKAEGLKKLVSAALRGGERFAEALGHESPTLKVLGGQPQTPILADHFFSQAPIRYGEYVAKVGVFPVSRELTELTGKPLKVDHRHPNALRQSVIDFFERQGGEWELRIQLCADLDSMPIEDASKVWPEEASPYVTVARIVAPRQRAWSQARAESDEALSFSPWHGLIAHQPLGSIMRLRKAVYEASADFRRERNHLIAEEPRSFSPLADT